MISPWVHRAVLTALALEGCVVDIGEIRFADGDATVSDGGPPDARDATETGLDARDGTPDGTPDEPFDAPSDAALDIIETGPLPPDAADVTDVPDAGAVTDGPRDAPPDGCAAGLFLCAGACVDLSTSTSHCGACGTACVAGVACEGGACVPACASPRIMCGTRCADLATDGAHCGVCGRVCPSGICAGGVCQPCASPRILCGSSCVDLTTDSAHCGMCAAACPAGRRCVGGVCTP